MPSLQLHTHAGNSSPALAVKKVAPQTVFTIFPRRPDKSPSVPIFPPSPPRNRGIQSRGASATFCQSVRAARSVGDCHGGWKSASRRGRGRPRHGRQEGLPLGYDVIGSSGKISMGSIGCWFVVAKRCDMKEGWMRRRRDLDGVISHDRYIFA